MCCSGEKIKLPPLNDPPEPLCYFFIGDSVEAKHFLANVRRYNFCFQMMSFGTSKEIKKIGSMLTFKVQGQVYHNIGSLLTLQNEELKFLQVYFVGDGSH